MKTKASYLIVNIDRKSIVRCTRAWPTLYPGEIAVRVSLEIPDTIRPVHHVVVDDEEAVIDVETVEASPPEGE